jgi:hypothetical protein
VISVIRRTQRKWVRDLHRDRQGTGLCTAYALKVYGVPPEQVVGSSIATKYGIKDGKPELIRLPKLFFDDDHAGKAIGVDLFIGKRPYAAFGNSTGTVRDARSP